MSSVKFAATKGKETRDAAQVRTHPFTLPQFKSKTVKKVRKNPVVPGSTVEACMLEECTGYILWIMQLECLIPMNAMYKRKVLCGCRDQIAEEDVNIKAEAMVQFFTLSQNGKDMIISEWVRIGRKMKKQHRDIKNWAKEESEKRFNVWKDFFYIISQESR